VTGVRADGTVRGGHATRVTEIAGLDITVQRQEGILTRYQMITFGVSDTAICRKIKRGDWQRVLPGVYSLRTDVISTEQRRISAALYAGPSAQLTGLAALHWHGFRHAPATDRVEVLVPQGTRRRSIGFVIIKRTLELDQSARTSDLYSVTSPARAVVDACRGTVDLRTVRSVMAEGVQRRYTSLHALDDELRRAGRSRTALARRVLNELLAGVRSSPEAELRTIVLSSGILPPPLWNPTVTTAQGQPLPTPDGWIPNAGIALEVDSREHHFSDEDWARTLHRHNVLARQGVLVLHFTPREIREDANRVLRMIEQTYLGRLAGNPTVDVLVRAPS
jgi:hypothetical protein